MEKKRCFLRQHDKNDPSTSSGAGDPMVIVYAVVVGFVLADLIFIAAICLK